MTDGERKYRPLKEELAAIENRIAKRDSIFNKTKPPTFEEQIERDFELLEVKQRYSVTMKTLKETLQISREAVIEREHFLYLVEYIRHLEKQLFEKSI